MLVGYLVIGALIGRGGLGLLSGESRELEYLARAGALLLLFSIGIEFSPGELMLSEPLLLDRWQCANAVCGRAGDCRRDRLGTRAGNSRSDRRRHRPEFHGIGVQNTGRVGTGRFATRSPGHRHSAVSGCGGGAVNARRTDAYTQPGESWPVDVAVPGGKICLVRGGGVDSAFRGQTVGRSPSATARECRVGRTVCIGCARRCLFGGLRQ